MQHFEDTEIWAALDGVTDEWMNRRKRFDEAVVMRFKRALRIDVARGSHPLSDGANRHIFRVQLTMAIGKEIHRLMLSGLVESLARRRVWCLVCFIGGERVVIRRAAP